MKNKILFPLILILIIMAAIESLSFATNFLITKSISLKTIDERLKSSALLYIGKEPRIVLHPYIGYVNNPKVVKPSEHLGTGISEFGFIDNNAPPFQKESNDLVIVITGGSVAAWFSITESELIKEELLKSSKFIGKNIRIANMASGGSKQPQALLSVAYLMSLGASFDIVINIDGFNEVAMPLMYNLPKNVYPFYPTDWYGHITKNDNEYVSLLRSIKKKRVAVANWLSQSFLRYDIFSRVLWFFYDQHQETLANSIKIEYENVIFDPSKDIPYSVSGPRLFRNISADKYPKFYQEIADAWLNSSLLTSSMLKSLGVKYYHFLQPNQYVEGSKKFTQEEIKTAYIEGSPKLAVRNGYKYLIDGGKKLRSKNIKFHDLTMIFKDTTQSVYLDTCCHLNSTGSKIMAKKIAQSIIEDY